VMSHGEYDSDEKPATSLSQRIKSVTTGRAVYLHASHIAHVFVSPRISQWD
jgi:hypothetical protein